VQKNRTRQSPYVSVATVAATLPPDTRSESTVRQWIADGRLPSIRIGRRRLVRREDAAEFLGIGVNELIEVDR
jgi:excisionase family DNA binding protein